MFTTRTRFRFVPFFAPLFALGCADSTGSTPTPTPTASDSGVFQPQGCGFKISTRAEYKDFAAGARELGVTPNIRRVRLGLGGNVAADASGRADAATSIAFAWETDTDTRVSEVAWGTTPDPTAWPAANRTSGVTWLTPAGLVNATGDTRMHEAYVCGLQPATTYYYRVGGGPSGQELWSDVYSFTTTPSDPSTKVTIGVSGDSRGQSNDAWRLIQKRMRAANVTVQVFTGDAINFAPDQGEWEKWLDLAAKDADGAPLTLAQILTLVAHGNHENHTTLFYGNVVMPQDVASYPSYAELFYSVDVGPVHLVAFDDLGLVLPDVDPAYSDVLMKWLRADLEAAVKNRGNVPWIVTMHHHSEYSSSSHGMDATVMRGREALVPLWDEFHVDLNLAGHDHNYERSKPLTGPASEPTVHEAFADGTVYVVCAGAGADPYPSGTSDFTATSRDYKTSGAFGFYAMLSADKTSLTFQAHELRADGSDPIVDDITITK